MRFAGAHPQKLRPVVDRDLFVQDVANGWMLFVQLPDGGVVVVGVNVRDEHVQRFLGVQRGQLALVPVEQKQGVLQFHQKTAVIQMGHFHGARASF